MLKGESSTIEFKAALGDSLSKIIGDEPDQILIWRKIIHVCKVTEDDRAKLLAHIQEFIEDDSEDMQSRELADILRCGIANYSNFDGSVEYPT